MGSAGFVADPDDIVSWACGASELLEEMQGVSHEWSCFVPQGLRGGFVI